MTTLEHLRQILAADYNLPADRLTPEARLDELGIDSLGVMEMLFRIEDEFHIRLPHELSELPPLATVGDVAAAVDTLISQQRGAPAGTPGAAVQEEMQEEMQEAPHKAPQGTS
ncbi:MAG: acyl carrier protein [Burkholderiaceae bacterium]